MDIIKAHMTLDEIHRNPTLSSALLDNKSLRFSLLTHNGYKINPTLIKSEKKQRLINSINTFRKIYGDYNRKVKFSTKEISNMSKQSNEFVNNYKNVMKKTGMAKKNLFLDVKAEYDKQNYNLPDLYDGKNIFKSSLLLSNNDKEIKNYIIYGFGNKSSNERTIAYLKKMDEGLDKEEDEEDKRRKKKIFESFNRLKPNIKLINQRYNSPISLYAYNKIPKGTLKEILTYRKDIKKLERTINSMQDIDYFFNADNKEYLDTLKYFYSRNTSANFSTSFGNNNSTFCDKKNTSNILSFKNISKYTFDERGSNINNKDRKNIKFDLGSNTANFFSGNSSLENNSSIKLIQFPKKKKIVKKKQLSKTNYHKTLETLYDKIANANDTMTYDKKIKSFLKLRKYKLKPKITKYNICNNIETLRENFFKDKTIKKVIYFRKNLGSVISSPKEKPEVEKKIYDIEEQMINTFAEIKN